MALVVECVGAAGVGKSYFTGLLVDELTAMGSPAVEAMSPVGPGTSKARRLCSKLGIVGLEVTRAPRAAVEMLRATMRSGQQRPRDTIALTCNWLVLRGLVRRARSGTGVHVFDQGALLGLWSTGLRGRAEPCRTVLEGPTWSWALPDVVVRVHAPPELTVTQLRGRGLRQSRLELLADGDLLLALGEAEAELDEIMEWWREQRRDGDAGLDLDVVNPGDDGLRAVALELAVGIAESGRNPAATQRAGSR